MKVGYVRLSRDDDRRNYVSIENQKLIISQYAQQNHMAIDRWYEDDGISGYIFERPGFDQLMKDLDKDIDTVIVKDFSRLGRHNAKVLLLLDEFQERGKHLIAIDDHYDSENPEDDTVGIKTWFNEKYVKDTSKKIRAAMGARQRDGTLFMQPPFGYRRNEKKKEIIEIVPKEAECVRLIYELYIGGAGYRKIAEYLTQKNMPTPSMIRHERALEEGKHTKRQATGAWSGGMVKELLDNDFYVGTLRLHKRARVTVHGKDRRVPKEEQCVFEDNHAPIIDKAAFDLVQEIKEKRNRNNYHGSRGSWMGADNPNPFACCLYCKDCGNRLTPITRRTGERERRYYICSTYNRKGRRYCAKAHLIEEDSLMNDVASYIRLCRDSLSEAIAAYDMRELEAEKKTAEEKCEDLRKAVDEQKAQLKTLLSQKIRDMAAMPEGQELIKESYETLQREIMARIQGFKAQLQALQEAKPEAGDGEEGIKTALAVVDEIIGKGAFCRKDIEILIEKIVVDENGFPEIELKYGFPDLVLYRPGEELNRGENEIILAVMMLIREDERGFTSAKYLSAALAEMGYKKTKSSIMPYIEMMLDMGVIERSDNPRKPYTIVKTADEIQRMMEKFCGDNGGVAEWSETTDANLHFRADSRRYAGTRF